MQYLLQSKHMQKIKIFNQLSEEKTYFLVKSVILYMFNFLIQKLIQIILIKIKL